MKSLKVCFAAILLISGQLLLGQKPDNTWEKWNYLIGEWVGEGNGKPGQNEGSFSFQTDLNGKILVRKNHTVFPETPNSNTMVHDDLLIVYQANPEGAQEAIYFDNEGNTIKYMVNFINSLIVLTSDKKENTPRFRLSYEAIDSKTVNITFEMASPEAPDKYKMYLSGKAFKVR